MYAFSFTCKFILIIISNTEKKKSEAIQSSEM